MARRGVRRGFSKGPKNNVWSVIVIEDLTIGTSTTEADIVTSSDLQAPLSGFQRFTLLRIRGWISVSKAVANTVASSLFMMIYTIDTDAGVSDPTNANDYVEEDVLWTWGHAQAANGAGAVESNDSVFIPVDVKAMRKIDSFRDVRFAVVSTGVGGVLLSAVLRGLTRKGGN